MKRVALVFPGSAINAHMNQTSAGPLAPAQLMTCPSLPLGRKMTLRLLAAKRRVGRSGSPAELPKRVYWAGPPAVHRAQPMNVRGAVPTNGL